MSMSGWGLTGRLVAKHFSALGDRFAEVIAGFDPETATEADRDRLQGASQQAANKLAAARSTFNKEQADVAKLRELIAKDELVAAKLGEQLAAHQIDEAMVAAFCDEMEANKQRLPQEEQEAAEAEQFVTELTQIVDAISADLAAFDTAAKKAKQQLERAEAQRDLEALRLNRQEQAQSLSGLRKQSTALSALSKRAEKISNEASGMKIVADIQQKPLDRAKAIDDLRASVSAPPAESLHERLARLAGKSEAPAAAAA